VYDHSYPGRQPFFNRIETPLQRESHFKRKMAPKASASSETSFALRPGDRVNHPAFGKGVISKFVDKTKVEVLFRDAGRKLLHLEHTILEKI
jgi:DNA helicase-2/ATP-dependent DNA helicase PcrA